MKPGFTFIPAIAVAEEAGFTLIEMSIVLVIIGLIVGGILTGQDLISAAAQRAQISQIEKYNTAVNTFRGKYDYIPGDMPDPPATSFGFSARGTNQGQGDGNGVIQTYAHGGWIGGYYFGGGETSVFWVDLGTAGMIAGSFNTATETNSTFATTTAVNLYFPPAKIEQGNYVYAWSGGILHIVSGTVISGNGLNYFGISAATSINNTGAMVSAPALTVQQAYNIDAKMDDGLPQSGRVTAIYASYSGASAEIFWAGAGAAAYNIPPYTTATAATATSCFDNSATANGTPGVAGATQHYSLEINAAAQNCALSLQFN